MSGEPREDMDIPLSDRLPPAVASRAFTWTSDSALSGAPLPPYRPGMHSGLLAAKPAISELSAALEAEHEVGPPVEEGWPAAWRDDPIPADEPVTADQPEAALAVEEPAETAELFLEEAEIEPADPMRDPTGYEQVVGEPEALADIASLASLDEPETAGDVHDWLEGGAVGSYDWGVDVEGEPVARYDAAEWPAEPEPEPEHGFALADESGLAAAEEPAFGSESEWAAAGESDWPVAEPGDETGELVEMVEQETDFGATLEFSPAAEEQAEPPADQAWAPFQPETPRAEEPETAEPAAESEAEDERVAIVPPTPIDSWFHGEQGADAAATWEAFGRALQEAASWGEPASQAAAPAPAAETGASEPAAAAEPSATAADEHATTSPADPAVADLARRLELLAQRLREEGEKGVEHALSEGDRLEASLAGFIAGWVAARRG